MACSQSYSLLHQLSKSPVLGSCLAVSLATPCFTAPPAFWPLLPFAVLPLGSQTESRANFYFSSTSSHWNLAGSILTTFVKGQAGQKSGLVVVYYIILVTDWSCMLWKQNELFSTKVLSWKVRRPFFEGEIARQCWGTEHGTPLIHGCSRPQIHSSEFFQLNQIDLLAFSPLKFTLS